MPEHDQQRADAPAADTFDASEPDYYATLGVRPEARTDEVRRAYHRLAKLWHPDRYMAAPPDLRARAERRMRALVAAYDTLGDPRKRRIYDLRHGRLDVSSHDVFDAAQTARYASARPASFATSHATGAYEAGHAGNPRGAGQFLALLCAIPALGILAAIFTRGIAAPGIYFAYGAVLALGGLAAWCLMEDSAPARFASHWMESEPRGAAGATADSDDVAPGEGEPTAFERLVDEALASVPEEFQEYLRNVAVLVEPEPSPEDLDRAEVPEGHTLFGLYHGVNLTRQPAAGAGPEEITIYQGPIERHCGGDPTRIREQVRATVLHELAHHFGIDHDDMPEWVR